MTKGISAELTASVAAAHGPRGAGAHLRTPEILNAIDAARASPLKWHEASLVIDRRQRSEAFSFTVTVLGAESAWKSRDLSVIVTTAGDDERKKIAAWRIMRERAFSGGTPAQRWFGSKDVRSATRATSEAERIFDLLSALRRR